MMYCLKRKVECCEWHYAHTNGVTCSERKIREDMWPKTCVNLVQLTQNF